MNDDVIDAPEDPNRPIAIKATPQFWLAVHALLMEAPIAGRIVAPISGVIAQHLQGRGFTP